MFDAWRGGSYSGQSKLARSRFFFLLSNGACVPVTLAQSFGFRKKKGGEEEREEEAKRERERGRGREGRKGREGEEGNRMTRRVEKEREGQE